MSNERVLFLFLHTGGGHLSAARAISERIAEIDPGASCVLFDPVKKRGSALSYFLEEGYRVASSYLRPVWILAYESQSRPAFLTLSTTSMSLCCSRAIEKKIRDEGITRVIVLHHLLTLAARDALHRIRASGGPRIPCLTVALDPFTMPRIWVHHNPFPLVVFSQQAKRQAIAYGYKAERIKVLPLALKKRFDNRLPPKEAAKVKESLGFDPAKPLVLIAGGGEGFPKGEFYLRALASAKEDLQVAIICGKDQLLKLKAKLIAAGHPEKTIVRYGFVDFMYELMNASDVILAKAGPATVMEALLLGKPLIVTQYIYGQEKGNMRFVVDNHLGYFLTKPKRVADCVERIFSEPERLKRLRANINGAGLRNGSAEIAAYALSLR